MSKLIFELIQADQPTKDVAPIIETYATARVVPPHRDKTTERIKELLTANRIKSGFDAVGFDAVGIMNDASDLGADWETVLRDFLPWVHENGALLMVEGSFMDLLVMLTEPLAE